MNKLEFKLNNEIITWEEKSHAQIWRNFWSYFTELNVEKTLETIQTAGLRISNEPEFIAKNGSRKKHVHIHENVWIYSHLTPKAMQNTYTKFLKFYEGEVQDDATDAPDAPSDVVAQPEEQPQEEIQLTPQQKAALTRKRNKEAKQREAEEKAKTPDNGLTDSDLEKVQL